MRKYRRMLLRSQAIRLGAKPSKFIKKFWSRYQISKYGSKMVAINQARGTHKKELWKSRVGLIAMNQRRGGFAA